MNLISSFKGKCILKILLVAFSDSVHTARWIEGLSDAGFDVHLFPSVDCERVHPDIKNVTVYHSFFRKNRSGANKEVKLKGVSVPAVPSLFRLLARRINPNYRVWQLASLIKKVKPDVIHSLEIQHGGYLVMEAKKIFKGRFPPWIVTNWGSDIYLFGRLPEHEGRIREVLASCEFYSCECDRDVGIAREFGFRGEVLPVFPNAGGFDLSLLSALRQPGPTSERRFIMLKGYQHWAGRALFGLKALERCAELLKDYTIVMYSVCLDENFGIDIAAQLFTYTTKIPVKIIPQGTSHREILAMHGKSRISIGLSISDGISTSFLEALVMGSFPVQSNTACADEWVKNGESAILVPPEDVDAIEAAVKRALTDDELVNKASEINYGIAIEKLEKKLLEAKKIELYKQVESSIQKRKATSKND